MRFILGSFTATSAAARVDGEVCWDGAHHNIALTAPNWPRCSVSGGLAHRDNDNMLIVSSNVNHVLQLSMISQSAVVVCISAKY